MSGVLPGSPAGAGRGLLRRDPVGASRARLACFGWSARAWSRPWLDFVRAHPGLQLREALEIGAGSRSSLAPLLLDLAQRVECSAHDAAMLPAIEALNARVLSADERQRVVYTRQDARALSGCWDLIVLKSVLGGLHRMHDSSISDVHATIEGLQAHLNPGGLLVTLDNGRTALEPLLARLGSRRNGWRFLLHEDFPPADACYGFGVLSVGSAATRLGWLGRRIDDGLFLLDCVLSPWARRHAVLLHVYRRPA